MQGFLYPIGIRSNAGNPVIDFFREVYYNRRAERIYHKGKTHEKTGSDRRLSRILQGQRLQGRTHKGVPSIAKGEL